MSVEALDSFATAAVKDASDAAFAAVATAKAAAETATRAAVISDEGEARFLEDVAAVSMYAKLAREKAASARRAEANAISVYA